MKILQKTIASTATLAFLLGSLTIPVSAATIKATPTVNPTPTEIPTAVPTIAPTPAPQSTLQWIVTHKKISLGVLLVVAAAGYGIYYLSTKNKQSPPEEQTKVEEEPKQEDQTPPEDQTNKEG